jgi:hypothetical protein
VFVLTKDESHLWEEVLNVRTKIRIIVDTNILKALNDARNNDEYVMLSLTYCFNIYIYYIQWHVINLMYYNIQYKFVIPVLSQCFIFIFICDTFINQYFCTNDFVRLSLRLISLWESVYFTINNLSNKIILILRIKQIHRKVNQSYYWLI